MIGDTGSEVHGGYTERNRNMKPKYPNINVKLTGEDGTAFMIIGRIRQAMRRNGVSQEEIQNFTTEAQSGDYTNVLVTAMRWVEVD